MGRVAEVLATERDADGALVVKVDPGGGAVTEIAHFAPPGVDAVPLPGDFAALEDSSGAGAEQTYGYHDPENAGTAEPGEHRAYSRSVDGVVVAELWLKRDGSVELRSLNGQPLRIVTTGPVILDSPDVRLSDAAGAQVARVGDLVMGTLHALGTTPGTPIVPGPPVPGGGVAFAASIVSGSGKVKA